MSSNIFNSNNNPSNPNPDVDPERLCEAAEAALKAVVEVAQVNGGRWIYPADIMSAQTHPSYFAGFTALEIEQASRFLARMGIIEPRTTPRAA